MQTDRQEDPVSHFREELMDEILAKHPGLTRAELVEQTALMGFWKGENYIC